MGLGLIQDWKGLKRSKNFNRLEFLLEKNGVCFYNDSKAETMEETLKSLKAFKGPIILIAGGKDSR